MRRKRRTKNRKEGRKKRKVEKEGRGRLKIYQFVPPTREVAIKEGFEA